MDTLYGWFDKDQFERFKRRLHKETHWLLIYKDPETSEDYSHVDFDKYFEGLMRRINGLSALLFYPTEIIELLNNLEAAYLETKKEELDFKLYRKLILDSHSIVDKIGR